MSPPRRSSNCWLFIPHRAHFPWTDGAVHSSFRPTLGSCKEWNGCLAIGKFRKSARPSAFAGARGPFAARPQVAPGHISMGRTLPMAARLLSLQAAAQAAHIPVAKTVVIPNRFNASVGRPLELHTSSQMPTRYSLSLQAVVLLSTAVCVDAAAPEDWPLWLLPLIPLGFYIRHCATCYPAQLIRRRILSMDKVDRIGSGTPSIRWRARAYHWETRWYRVRINDKDGKFLRQEWRSHQVQVTTHKIDVVVPALEWSYEERRSGLPSESPWTSVSARFRAYPRNWQEYEAVRSEFRYFHDRDRHFDFTETVILDGVQLSTSTGLVGAIEGAWGETQFFLLLSPEGARDAPTLTTWVLVCMLMISAPYQMWLESNLKARGASAAVEYTRGFKLDVGAARLRLGLNQLIERERAIRAIQHWRGLRSLVRVGTAAMGFPSMLLP